MSSLGQLSDLPRAHTPTYTSNIVGQERATMLCRLIARGLSARQYCSQYGIEGSHLQSTLYCRD